MTVQPSSPKVRECEAQGHGTIVPIAKGDHRLMCLRCGLVVVDPGRGIDRLKKGE